MGRKKNQEKQLRKQNVPIWLKRPYLIIIIIPLIVYIKTAGFDFVGVDDDNIILDQYDKISSLSNLPQAFTSQYGFNESTPYYRPVINLSFFIDALIAGKSSGWYHFSNILFHIIAGSLLFMLLVKLGLDNIISLIVSLLFLLHPLLTNSVAWIAGRNDLIAGIFCLLSFIFFLKYLSDSSNKNFLLHFLFYLLGIFSKETVLVLPIACLVYMYIFKRKEFARDIIIRFTAVWLITIILSQLLKLYFVQSIGNVTYGLPALLANIRVIPEAVYKIIIPVNISVLPTFSYEKTFLGFAFLIIIIILPFSLAQIDKKKYYFGLFWFFLFLLPGLLVVYANQAESFDYLDTRDYIPLMGLILSIGTVLPGQKIKSLTNKSVIAVLVIFLIFAVLTFYQINKYKDPVNFAENAVESNPERPFFYQKLADYYFNEKDYTKAIEYLKQSIQREPGAFIYHKNLALAYLHLNQKKNAVPALEKAYELNNKDRDVVTALIRINYELQNYKESLYYVNKVIQMGGKVDPSLYKSLQDLVKLHKQ